MIDRTICVCYTEFTYLRKVQTGRSSISFYNLLNEYDEVRTNLEKELSGADKAVLYMNLNKLIIKIADYICQNEEKVRKGIGEIMGGKVLELESERLERLRKEAEAEAKEKGEKIGKEIGEK